GYQLYRGSSNSCCLGHNLFVVVIRSTPPGRRILANSSRHSLHLTTCSRSSGTKQTSMLAEDHGTALAEPTRKSITAPHRLLRSLASSINFSLTSSACT